MDAPVQKMHQSATITIVPCGESVEIRVLSNDVALATPMVAALLREFPSWIRGFRIVLETTIPQSS